MKNQYTKKSLFGQFFGHVMKNLAALFESSDKREFQRLKNFIAS